MRKARRGTDVDAELEQLILDDPARVRRIVRETISEELAPLGELTTLLRGLAESAIKTAHTLQRREEPLC